MKPAAVLFIAVARGYVEGDPGYGFQRDTLPAYSVSCVASAHLFSAKHVALQVLFDAIDYMTPEGHLLFNRHTSEWPLCDSDVVCVRSLPTPPNAPYLQTAVLFAGSIRERRYAQSAVGCCLTFRVLLNGFVSSAAPVVCRVERRPAVAPAPCWRHCLLFLW